MHSVEDEVSAYFAHLRRSRHAQGHARHAQGHAHGAEDKEDIIFLGVYIW